MCVPCHRCVVYTHTLTLFAAVEEELMRVASHHTEMYAHQLQAAGRERDVDRIDW